MPKGPQGQKLKRLNARMDKLRAAGIPAFKDGKRLRPGSPEHEKMLRTLATHTSEDELGPILKGTTSA